MNLELNDEEATVLLALITTGTRTMTGLLAEADGAEELDTVQLNRDLHTLCLVQERLRVAVIEDTLIVDRNTAEQMIRAATIVPHLRES